MLPDRLEVVQDVGLLDEFGELLRLAPDNAGLGLPGDDDTIEERASLHLVVEEAQHEP